MKEELRKLIDAGRAKEASDLLPLVDDSPPAAPGRWTAKDQLAHLTAWRKVAVQEIESIRTGAPAPDVSPDDDVQNAKFYAQTHDMPAAKILETGRESWDELAKAIEACTEEDLLKPRTRDAGQPAWQTIPANTYFHLAEHLVYWHSEQGDDRAAEEAASWGHDLAVSTFRDDYTRGVAAYNFGCFYAKRGRAREAVPFLRKGIQLRPNLHDWAQTDTDLDPIRSDPEVVRLLG